MGFIFHLCFIWVNTQILCAFLPSTVFFGLGGGKFGFLVFLMLLDRFFVLNLKKKKTKQYLAKNFLFWKGAQKVFFLSF